MTLEGQLAWGLDVEGSEDIRPFRDAYLRPFAHWGDAPALEEAQAIALRLGWICRALNWHRIASGLDSPAREEALRGTELRLRLFRAGLADAWSHRRARVSTAPANLTTSTQGQVSRHARLLS